MDLERMDRAVVGALFGGGGAERTNTFQSFGPHLLGPVTFDR